MTGDINTAAQRAAVNNGAAAQMWDGMPMPSRVWAVVAAMLAVGMAVLDGVIVNIALPTICDGLAISASESIWIINAYQIAVILSLLPLSALGDSIGYRKVYLAGLSLFTLMSVGCALSWDFTSLVVCRILQGLGASAVMSINASIVRLIYPRRMLGRGMGFNSTIVSVSSVAGPTLAAALLSVAQWPILFAVNIPLGLLAILLGYLYIPHNPVLQRAAKVFPFDLLRIPIFRLSVATSIFSFIAQMSVMVAMPFILQRQYGYTPLEVGAMITAWPVVNLFSTPIAGFLVDRLRPALLGCFGIVVLFVGMTLLALLPDDPEAWDVMLRLAICGFGFGFFQAPNNNIIITSVPLERSGAASGMMAAARITGQILGAASVALIFLVIPEQSLSSILYLSMVASLVAAVLSFSRLSARPIYRPKY
ncbi:MAG: MFS transporter [Rikenellaceae bacterium]